MDMCLWNALPAEDKEKIEWWIENYGDIDAEPLHNHAPLSRILSYWDTNKRDLFDIFNHSLTLDREIEIKMPAEELKALMVNLKADSAFVNRFLTWMHEYAGPYGGEKYNSIYSLQTLLYTNYLEDNRYDGETFDLITDDGKKVRIQHGCKLSKAFSTIQKKFNITSDEIFEEFRVKHSQILNTKSLKGRLTLSIHPLDYLTMSDNGCGWGSCMSWMEDGDYHMGTIEMMNSPCVVIAYLNSSSPWCLGGVSINDEPELQWTNKRWRELFIVDPYTITGIKGYPYVNRELENVCLDWLRGLVDASGKTIYGPYGAKPQAFYNNCDNHIFAADKQVRLNYYCNCMYNDIYDEHYAYFSTDIEDSYTINYSGETVCLACGCAVEDPAAQECRHLICYDCNDYVKCYECGDWHSREDMIEIDGELYCDYCYNEYFSHPECCGQLTRYSDVIKIFLARNGLYNERDAYEGEICPDCFAKWEDKYHLHRENYYYWSRYWTLDVEEIPKDDQKAFVQICNVFGFDEEGLLELIAEAEAFAEQQKKENQERQYIIDDYLFKPVKIEIKTEDEEIHKVDAFWDQACYIWNTGRPEYYVRYSHTQDERFAEITDALENFASAG